MKVINFDDRLEAKTVFFFGESKHNGQTNLFRNCGNPYTLKLRGKYIIVNRELAKKFPKYCYLKVSRAIEKDSCFIITEAALIMSRATSLEELNTVKAVLVSRPDYAEEKSVRYYNAKSKLGEITCLVVTYKLRGHDEIFYDSYLNNNGYIFMVESPNNVYSRINGEKAEDYSKINFKDFEEIK